MNHSVLDLDGLRRLSGNDEAFIVEILELYSNRAQADIKELQEAHKSEDWDAIRFIVHRMRSSAIPLGLKDLVILLKRTELEVKAGNLARIPEFLSQIVFITEQACTEVDSLVKTPSS
jgi:HPt (histidine-containing phosphotransfer) domain-containing protein